MKIELVLLAEKEILTSEFENEAVFEKFAKVNSVKDFKNLVDEFDGELRTLDGKEIYSRRSSYFKYIDLSSSRFEGKFLDYSSFRNLTGKLVNMEAYDDVSYKKSLLTQLPEFGTRVFRHKAFCR